VNNKCEPDQDANNGEAD